MATEMSSDLSAHRPKTTRRAPRRPPGVRPGRTHRTGAAKDDARQNAARLLAAYTGIEPSQLRKLSDRQAGKVFSSLTKQIDVAVSLHGADAKRRLHETLAGFLTPRVGSLTLEEVTQRINSLLVFGDVRPLEDTGVAFLHERTAHFWRILGWEELALVRPSDGAYKLAHGSIREVERTAGNLIRTLDLLAERWVEHRVGPYLVYPTNGQKITEKRRRGFGELRLVEAHSNAAVVATSAEELVPTAEHERFLGEQLGVLRRLLARYPLELTYAIYDYYAAMRGLGSRSLCLALLQEYERDGCPRVKGIVNGPCVVLRWDDGVRGDRCPVEAVAASGRATHVGSLTTSEFEAFDVPVSEQQAVTVIYGRPALALIDSPGDLDELVARAGRGGFRERVVSYAKAKDAFRRGIPSAKQDKPIVTLRLRGVEEYRPVAITPRLLDETAARVLDFVCARGIDVVALEAAHIHADTTPTGRQRTGMRVGADLARRLEEAGIGVRRTTMIDEDHVPNALDHAGYVRLMRSRGFEVDEVLYESSPAVREIAVAAVGSLRRSHRDRIRHEGDTVIFDIPGSDLRAELVRDTTAPVVELGCVIFDVGLTLAKVYPELAGLYSADGTASIHARMLDLYRRCQDVDERQRRVKATFPERTRTYEDVLRANPLPPIGTRRAAVVNVLEGFYSAQQVKVAAMLRTLGISIALVDVAFSDQGIRVHLPRPSRR